jgi:hypothetical protein
MKFACESILCFLVLAPTFGVFSQNIVTWRDYVDSTNEIWFQAPEQVVIRLEDKSDRIDVYAFFNGAGITISKQKVGQEPMKYVRSLKLPFGERGTVTRDFKLDTFLVRQEIEPLGSNEIAVRIYAGSKKSYFEIVLRGTKDKQWFEQFLQTVRFGGSRIVPNSTIPDLKAVGEPVVFDKLPASPEVESSLDRKITDDTIDSKYEVIKNYVPLQLDQLSRDLIILEKPKAIYTDSARMNNVQGTIPANIEFLANGEIGKIIVDNRLDLSLARNVVRSAKKIRFLPARANDQPVTVVRTLLYKFMIY